MKKVVSVHEYTLSPNVNPQDFEETIHQARQKGLLQLPGLDEYFLLKGIRGARKGRYTAIWIFESEESWANLWGPVGQPLGKDAYPENWKIWEDQVLAPFLSQDPDQIRFTAYREI